MNAIINHSHHPKFIRVNFFQTQEKPCQIPKTYNTNVVGCNEVLARNLRARSHMIAWVGIVSICLVSFVLFVFYKAMSSLSYEQNRWVQLYKEEERTSMSRKLRQRASDLAQEITKQFLLEERFRVQSFSGALFIRYKLYRNPNAC